MDDEWARKRKVSTLPGTVPDAVTVLARTLDKAQQGHVEAVATVIVWRDGTLSVDYSKISSYKLAAAALALQGEAMGTLMHDPWEPRYCDPDGVA